MEKCLRAWGGFEKVHVHYIAIENDENCKSVLRMNFPADVKSEQQGQQEAGGSDDDNVADVAEGSGGQYLLTQWNDVTTVLHEIEQGKHAKFLEDVFLSFGGFPCNNLSGNNRAAGANGRTGLDGPQTSLFYAMEKILRALGLTEDRGQRLPRESLELELELANVQSSESLMRA